MTSTALRVYTTVIGAVCVLALAWSARQIQVSNTWQAEARQWHGLVVQAAAADRRGARRFQIGTARYNQLVIQSRRSQQKLQAALRTATAVPAAGSAVYQSPGSAPAPVAAPVAVAAPPPTTSTSPPPP